MAERVESLNVEDVEVLVHFLRERGLIGGDEEPRVERLAGGVSNRTMLVHRSGGETWVVKQPLAKLRVPVDWFGPLERIHREALGLRWLAQLAPAGAVPRFIFEDHAHHVLVMEAVPQPHVNWKTMLLAGDVRAGHVEQFGCLLGTIHRRSYARRAEVAPAFEDRSFFQTLRLEPYYGYAASQVPAAASFLQQLIDETCAHAITLVHGDFSPKNILVYRDRLILLDHEAIHWGDPTFDLGFSMTHLLSKAHHVPAHRSDFAGAAGLYWRTYRQVLGDVPWAGSIEERAVRQALGCLLARVAGRSPLEYLSREEQTRQQEAVLALMPAPPTTVAGLIDAFIERL